MQRASTTSKPSSGNWRSASSRAGAASRGASFREAPRIRKMCPSSTSCSPSTGKLSYNGKSWLTVVLEVGHDEIGDADEVEYGLAEDVAALFDAVGLPAPWPSPLMPLHYQIAQKLHAVSTLSGDRLSSLAGVPHYSLR